MIAISSGNAIGRRRRDLTAVDVQQRQAQALNLQQQSVQSRLIRQIAG